ncbi:hypothetical protein T09_11509 [Trichinella sp. T9]|nr:hypothetical protein T09_11509 [Trichinella sp. T9]
MNDTICDKQRHIGTARKRLYVHANTGCKRYKLHGMTNWETAPNTVRSNCKYLWMFVMQNLEPNDVNMTYHVAQSKRNTIKIS